MAVGGQAFSSWIGDEAKVKLDPTIISDKTRLDGRVPGQRWNRKEGRDDRVTKKVPR